MKVNCPICKSNKTKKVDKYYGYTFPFNRRSSLFKCNSCEMVFMSPAPNNFELEQFYKSYWYNENPVQDYNKIQHQIQFKSRLDYLLVNNIKLEKKTILDFGAGHCLFFDMLIKNNIKNVDYNAVEADEELIRLMGKNGIRIKNNINEYGMKKFDMIILFHILEHLLNPIDLINELSNYLNQGGYIFIEIPNQDNVWKKNLEPHVLFFNISSLTKLLELSGFQIIVIDTCGESLSKLKMGKTRLKMLKNRFSRLLRDYKIVKENNEPNPIYSEGKIIKLLKVNDYGIDRQWIRAIAKKL